MHAPETTLRRSLRPATGMVLVMAAVLGCGQVEQVAQELFDSRTARERYDDALETAGLASTALVRDWRAAAERALHDAAPITTPHIETGYLPPSEPTALAYRVNLRRGQEVVFDFELPGDTSTLVFLEAYQLERDTTLGYRLVEAADSGRRVLEIEPRRDGDYVFRVQTELLRGGRFTVTIQVGPTLAFPVHGGRESDIGSIFGDPRDGGARNHHGIDIFAPRGTPVLAAAEARVSRVQVTPRGGKVVWLRDERGNRLYYAHLDSQMVAQGQRVRPGDTLGLVGNTGNAITTPPHLHFGVYRRGDGPVNPFWFVHRPRGTAPRLAADTSLLGEWARTPRDDIKLRTAPAADADSIVTLPRHTAVRVLAAAGAWFRVRLPDGGTGYLSARFAEPADRAVRTAELAAPSPLLARPTVGPTNEDVIARLAAGEGVPVLGRFGDYLLVQVNGYDGWLAADSRENSTSGTARGGNQGKSVQSSPLNSPS